MPIGGINYSNLDRAAFHIDKAIVVIIVPIADAKTRFCKGTTVYNAKLIGRKNL
jgi:hypothetical protein